MAKRTLRDRTRGLDAKIGARVRAARMRACFSQERLADEIGVTFQQIQKYERGTNRIGSGSLVVIASILHTTTAELLAGLDEAGGSDIAPITNSQALRAAELISAMQMPSARHSALAAVQGIALALQPAAAE